MENEKTEFSEAMTDMAQFAGALAGAAVVAGRKLVCYINDLTTVETNIKPPADEELVSDVKSSQTDTEVD